MAHTVTAFRPAHLSVSSVELYLRCPAQFRVRYVDGLVTPSTSPQAWGSAFHKALEAEHNGQDGDLAWLAAWNTANANLTAAGTLFAPGKMHGVELLEQFRSRGLSGAAPAEVRFRLSLPGGRVPVPILGFIDAMPSHETREYKTSAGGWWTETKAALAYQTHVYGWARQRIKSERRPLRYVIFGTRQPTITEYVVEPSPDGLRLFELATEAAWQGIVEQRYAGCGERKCPVCTPPTAADAPAPPGPQFVFGEETV